MRLVGDASLGKRRHAVMTGKGCAQDGYLERRARAFAEPHAEIEQRLELEFVEQRTMPGFGGHMRGLRVIEDSALVMGSAFRGKPVGAIGDLVTFSFHPNKNMTTIEGGAIVCNDAEEARRIEVLRFHGIERNADGTRDVAFPG